MDKVYVKVTRKKWTQLKCPPFAKLCTISWKKKNIVKFQIKSLAQQDLNDYIASIAINAEIMRFQPILNLVF